MDVLAAGMSTEDEIGAYAKDLPEAKGHVPAPLPQDSGFDKFIFWPRIFWSNYFTGNKEIIKKNHPRRPILAKRKPLINSGSKPLTSLVVMSAFCH